MIASWRSARRSGYAPPFRRLFRSLICPDRSYKIDLSSWPVSPLMAYVFGRRSAEDGQSLYRIKITWRTSYHSRHYCSIRQLPCQHAFNSGTAAGAYNISLDVLDASKGDDQGCHTEAWRRQTLLLMTLRLNLHEVLRDLS
jgi:hypothetical protein